jgi:hypothetical protein
MKRSCFIELLNLNKPLKNSCLSSQQIDVLYEQWKDFMTRSFQGDDMSLEEVGSSVDSLFIEGLTIQQKYDALQLGPGSEESWILGHSSPNDFTTYLKTVPNILENLSMSFYPRLHHDHELEAIDITNSVVRYVYWFKNHKKTSMNVLTIGQNIAEPFKEDKLVCMQKSLRAQWEKFRFHVAILANHSWLCVLIDRYKHTFEVYEPCRNNSSGGSNYLRGLHKTATELDPKLIHCYKQPNIGTNVEKCGVFILMFLLYRIAQGVSYTNVLRKRLTAEMGQHLRTVLFYQDTTSKKTENIRSSSQVPASYSSYSSMSDPSYSMSEPSSSASDSSATWESSASSGRGQSVSESKSSYSSRRSSTRSRPRSTDYRLRYGDYEYRLAVVIYTSVYLDTILLQLDNQPAVTGPLQKLHQSLIQLAESDTHYQKIIFQVNDIQHHVNLLLSGDKTTYEGSRSAWVTIVDSIVNDVYSDHLRNLKNSAGKSHNSGRHREALQVFREIASCVYNLNKELEFSEYTRCSLDHKYIPVLLFQPGNHKYFKIGMTPEDFLDQTVDRKETVSFGVRFLRDLDEWSHIKLDCKNNVTLCTKFPNPCVLTKPLIPKNVQEISSIVTQCEATMKEAQKLLEESLEVQYQTEVQSIATAIPPPTQSQLAVDPPLQLNKLSALIENNEREITEHTFLDYGVQPWNFPMNYTVFHFRYPEVELQPEFKEYSVNDQDMLRLIESHKFKLYYTIGVQNALHGLQTLQLSVVGTQILLSSLMQFFQIAETPEDQAIFCALLNAFYLEIQEPREEVKYSEELAGDLPILRIHHRKCENTAYTQLSDSFFDKVSKLYGTIWH